MAFRLRPYRKGFRVPRQGKIRPPSAANFRVVRTGDSRVNDEIELKSLAVNITQHVHEPGLGPGAIERAENVQHANRVIRTHDAHLDRPSARSEDSSSVFARRA